VVVRRAGADEVAKTFTVSGHAHVRVQTDDGSVRVSTGAQAVEIRVEYTGYKLDRDLQVSTSQNGDAVEVIGEDARRQLAYFGVRHFELAGGSDICRGCGPGSDVGRWVCGGGSLPGIDVERRRAAYSVQGAGEGNIRLHTGDGHIEDGRWMAGRTLLQVTVT